MNWNIVVLNRTAIKLIPWILHKAGSINIDCILVLNRRHHSLRSCMGNQYAHKLCHIHKSTIGNHNTQKAILNTSPLEVNTNVVKDVILYRYENPKFFRNLGFFAICQFGFWVYLSHFAFTTLKDAPVPKNEDDNLPWWRKINLGENKYRNFLTITFFLIGFFAICQFGLWVYLSHFAFTTLKDAPVPKNEDDNLPWWRKINLGENKYRNFLTITFFLIGYGILTASWMYILRSVRYLVLRKGGNQVTFITYTPYGHNRMMTINLSKVSSQESRQNARVHIPIKVRNHALHYMLDMRGEFRNPALFDLTVGLHRAWKKK